MIILIIIKEGLSFDTQTQCLYIADNTYSLLKIRAPDGTKLLIIDNYIINLQFPGEVVSITSFPGINKVYAHPTASKYLFISDISGIRLVCKYHPHYHSFPSLLLLFIIEDGAPPPTPIFNVERNGTNCIFKWNLIVPLVAITSITIGVTSPNLSYEQTLDAGVKSYTVTLFYGSSYTAFVRATNKYGSSVKSIDFSVPGTAR